MNKNHFIMPYDGNKRTEVKEIYNALNFENIEYICEPFCGSSAISFYISTLHPKKYTYILNDIDKDLITLYETIKDINKWNYLRVLYQLQIEAIKDKQTYKNFINQKGLISYLIKNKYYSIRPGLYPINGNTRKINLHLNHPFLNFIRTEKIILYSGDATFMLKKYNNNKTLFIMDPPYLFTCNAAYNNGTLDIENYNIYEHILNIKKKYKSNIYFVLEYQWFIDILFKNKIIHKYTKKYTGVRKKTVVHCIIKI